MGRFSPEFFALLKEAICVNSTASITEKGEDGSKTEIAMLKMLISVGHDDYDDVRNRFDGRVVKQFPFNSNRKRSSVVVVLDDGVRRRVHVKGASEVVFGLCNSV